MKINLVPEVQETKVKKQKLSTIAIAAATAIVVLTVLVILVINVIFYVERANLSRIKQSITKVEAETEQYRELEENVISLEKGLNEVKRIMSGENEWNKLLAHIEKATPAGVSFSGLSVKGGAIDIQFTAQNIDELSRMIDSYKGYTVMVLKGTGVNPGTEVSATVGGNTYKTASNIEGNWTISFQADPKSDQVISLEQNAEKKDLTYKAQEGAFVENIGISASFTKLFNGVIVENYTKDNDTSNVNSTLKANYEGSALW